MWASLHRFVTPSFGRLSQRPPILRRVKEVQTDDLGEPAAAEVMPFRAALTAGWMAVLPIISFWMASTDEFTPTYQEGFSIWMLMFNLGTAGWYAVPIPLSIALAVGVILEPRWLSIPIVRLGLQVSFAFACLYCLAMMAATLVFGLIPAGIGLLAVAVFRAVVKAETIRDTVSLALLSLIIAVGFTSIFGGLDSVPATLDSALFVVVLPAGPFICAWIIYRLLHEHEGASASAAGYGAAFTVVAGTSYGVITRSLNRYNELPPSPDCYVATAAASGHQQFVGSSRGHNDLPVNRQLQTFKAGEIVVRSVAPRTHEATRRVYDRVGPPAARLLRRHQLLADAAYLTLLPAQIVVQVGLRIVLRQRERELVGCIYR